MKKLFTLAALVGAGMIAASAWAGGYGFHDKDVSCFQSPIGAASSAATYFPGFSDLATCEDLCSKWESTCKGWVKAASTCLKSEASKTASLEKSECVLAANPTVCKQGIGGDLETYLDNLIADTNTAKANCESNESNCLSYCQN